MRRSPRVLLAWTAAAIVVIVTVRVVAGDLGALHRRAHALGPDVPVVFAAHDLSLGTTIRPGDVRVVRRPANIVGADTVRDPATVLGRVVAVALLRDDVLTARHLVSGTSGAIPDGRRAVHVVVKDGFRPPVGAVVDVLAAFDPAIATMAGAPGRAAVVARGAQVLALSSAPPGEDAGALGGSSAADTTGAGVTVLVTEDEARAVAYAAAIGEVMLALAPVQNACCGGRAS
jgi:Flp pilus assembly protein CpaB